MSDPERTLTFTGHLEELRTRLIRALVTWIVTTAISFPLAPKAIGLLTRPLAEATRSTHAPRLVFNLVPQKSSGPAVYAVTARLENVTTGTKRLDQLQVDIVLPGGQTRPIGEGATTGTNFYYQHLTDPITLIFKAALILGVILALPEWIYEIWAFVRPGLKANEKRLVRPLFGMCAVLFPIGVAFAYFMLQLVIAFLLSIQIQRVSPLLDYSRYARFAMQIMIGFGIVFELPVVILLLAHLGVVTPAMLRKYRPYAIVIIAVAAMIFTPPDPISMTVMMIPLVGLYELSVWLSYMAARTAAKTEPE